MIRVFLDDERFPVSDDLIIFRTAEDLILHITTFGEIIEYMSFDHDLGIDVMTGYDFVKWAVDRELSGFQVFSDNFTFYVHSQNPIGATAIRSLLDNYLAYKS